jgi:hypothetical protein
MEPDKQIIDDLYQHSGHSAKPGTIYLLAGKTLS